MEYSRFRGKREVDLGGPMEVSDSTRWAAKSQDSDKTVRLDGPALIVVESDFDSGCHQPRNEVSAK